MTKREPVQLTGKYGTASNFGSLDGWTLAEAEAYLSGHPDLSHFSETEGGYKRYMFEDKSEVHIRPNGEIIRIPRRIYEEDGSRVKGRRLNIYDGEVYTSADWHNRPEDEQEWVIVP